MSSVVDPTNGEELLRRVHAAMNAHDLEALASCFSENYVSEQPAHPDRAFTGTDQLRKNWATVFKSVPDFKAELLRHAIVKDTAWSEWTWHGTRMDGHPLDIRGVIILRAEGRLFVHVTLYMEAVQTGAGIDAAVRSGLGAQ